MEPPKEKEYKTRDPKGDSVFYVNYDMVQSQVSLVNRAQKHNKELFPYARVYNKYYGRGLSSIVFQEIREKRGLAYSASSSFSRPDTGKFHFVRANLGTQADKTKDAIKAMKGLLEEMPEAEKQFQLARENILKSIETNRITGPSIFFSYLDDQKKGFEKDAREYIYNEVQDMTLTDMKQFFNDHVKKGSYDLLIMSNEENLPPSSLSEFGHVKQLDRDVLFGYKTAPELTQAPEE